MAIGVVVVTFEADDIITDCLESLLASAGGVDLRIVVADNASSDQTVKTIRDWAGGTRPPPPVAGDIPYTPVPHGPVPLVEGAAAVGNLGRGEIGLITSSENLGFAGGVNLGLRALMANPDVTCFWVLNPDCMAGAGTAKRLQDRAQAAGRFGIIGGRVYYTTPPDMIQADGGRVNLWTGICNPCNLRKVGKDVPAPDQASLDYIVGSHMFVSRDFIEQAGFMPEDYFLYYEEVDWSLRRGDLPLLFEPEAAVYHHGGHTIGSATVRSGPSPLSAYFLNRARMRFVARYRPWALPISFTYSTTRAIRALLRGQRAAGLAALRGLFGMPPSQAMLARIGRKALPDRTLTDVSAKPIPSR